jgi:predicted MFS family arabinose efflux permease
MIVEKYGWRIGMRTMAFLCIPILIAGLVGKSKFQKVHKWPVKEMMKKRSFQILLVIGFCGGYGFLTPYIHITSFALDKGIKPTAAVALLSIMGGLSTIGRISLGLLADKFGKMLMFQLCLAMMAMTTFVWAFLSSNYVGKCKFFSFVLLGWK